MEVTFKNNLLYWRQKLGYKFAKKFAKDMDIKYVSYIQWENNKTPISLESLIKIWQFIKLKYPETKLEDLLIILEVED